MPEENTMSGATTPDATGEHPILMVVLTARDLAASVTFYRQVFGWQLQSMAPDLAAGALSAGPSVALRANVPDGFPGMVPFIRVGDVDTMLQRIAAAGGSLDKAPWNSPGGTLARFSDRSGTIYGLTSALTPGPLPRLEVPFGTNPKPPQGTVCSIEMYARDADAPAEFFGSLFGWRTQQTMPQYLGFDPGAGIGGVFQAHTPTLPAVAYIYVTNVAATLTALEAAGGKRLGDPMAIPNTATFGYFTDPSGTTMGLVGS
jgi:uncharacterized protein